MLRGFDVSHHNGTVDWAALKSRYGITWGAAKATEGTGFKDSQFPANWRKMKAAGLVRAAYHFAHPGGDPAVAARAFLAYVRASGGIDPTDIMVMDMEGNPNNLPMLTVRDWLAGWADTITRETGRKPFLYVGSGYITNNATKDLRAHYAAWWFPRYPAAYDGKTTWPASITGYPASNNWGGAPDIWQFSQSFARSMDANIGSMTLADLKTRGHDTQEDDVLNTDDRNYIERRVQAYAAFGAKHTDQVLRTAVAQILAALGADTGKATAAVQALNTELDKRDAAMGAELEGISANLAAHLADD